jgi:hypothetical protein
LNGVGLQVGEQKEQPIFRRCQRAGPVDGEATSSSGFPIEPPRRPWNSKGVTRAWNSSRVKLVRLRNSAGRACTSANRTPVMHRASCQGTVLSLTQHIVNRDKLKCPAKEHIKDANSVLIPMPTAPRHDSRQKVDHERN